MFEISLLYIYDENHYELCFVLADADCTVTCSSWVAVPTGASCYSISDAHKITMSKFQSLNPNLVCSKLFAKQWVCVVGIGC
ncbi:hypothetical protein LINGRAHAP2_LOCUS28776 [Linum grandiflorum]